MAVQQLSLLFFICMWLVHASIDGDSDPELNRYDSSPCSQYDNTVKQLSADIWLLYSNLTACQNDTNRTTALRVRTESLNARPSEPVVFVTRSGSRVQNWHLPYSPRTFSRSYTSSKHTLCSLPSSYNDTISDVLLYMDVFTSSASEVKYSFEFELVEDFVLELNQSISFNVSPNEPQLYYYKIPENLSSVRIVVSSQDKNNCAIVSVQNASCPVNEQLQNAMTKGAYQTMTTSASLVVTAGEDITGSEFFIVVVSANEDVCDQKSGMTSSPTTNSSSSNNNDFIVHKMSLKIEKLSPASSFGIAIATPIIVFLAVGIITFLMFLFSCFQCSFVLFRCTDCLKVKCKYCTQPIGDYEPILGGNDECDGDSDGIASLNTNRAYGSTGNRLQREASNEDAQVGYKGLEDPLEDSIEQSGVTRALLKENETSIMLPQLMKKGYSNLDKSYKVYGWNTVTVGIFYALPAFQLVFSEQTVLIAHGDQDICYYNFKCAHPYAKLSAFNNVLSNVGYLIMGLSFLGIVAIRDLHAYRQRRKNKAIFDSRGVPQFYGVYYAMGFGLVMEGFMSGFYHICPSDNNFQFDTAFMFIIGGLLIVKMLQARHPDIQANAFVAFFSFAIVIFLTFIGIWEWSKPYWQTQYTLIILAAIGFVIFAISYYFFHDWRYGHWIENHTYKRIFQWFKSWCILCNSREKTRQFLPKHPYRFFKMTLLVFANIIAGIVMVVAGEGIATVVLALFILNFLLLMLLYIVCKIYYREPFTLMPVVFVVIVGCLWGASFYFYFSSVSQWEATPARSREYNKDCIVMDFYDNHDIWHFLSAAAMFFSFLFLFTLDDGTQDIERERLHVF